MDSCFRRDFNGAIYFTSGPGFQFSLMMALSVIPAKAGIQLFQLVRNSMDSGFHRSDDFLQVHLKCANMYVKLNMAVFISL